MKLSRIFLCPYRLAHGLCYCVVHDFPGKLLLSMPRNARIKLFRMYAMPASSQSTFQQDAKTIFNLLSSKLGREYRRLPYNNKLTSSNNTVRSGFHGTIRPRCYLNLAIFPRDPSGSVSAGFPMHPQLCSDIDQKVFSFVLSSQPALSPWWLLPLTSIAPFEHMRPSPSRLESPERPGSARTPAVECCTRVALMRRSSPLRFRRESIPKQGNLTASEQFRPTQCAAGFESHYFHPLLFHPARSGLCLSCQQMTCGHASHHHHCCLRQPDCDVPARVHPACHRWSDTPSLPTLQQTRWRDMECHSLEEERAPSTSFHF